VKEVVLYVLQVVEVSAYYHEALCATRMVTLLRHSQARVWDLDSGSRVSTFAIGEPRRSIPSLHPYVTEAGEPRLVIALQRSVSIWDPEAGALLHRLDGHHSMAISSTHLFMSQHQVFVASIDYEKVSVWLLGTGGEREGPCILRAANKTG
jgi:WD40 repeat protein